MKRILKYDVNQLPFQLIPMPKGAEIVAVKEQHGYIRLWAAVQDGVPVVNRQILIATTGFDSVPDASVHLGTLLLQNGHLVLHFFDGGEV